MIITESNKDQAFFKELVAIYQLNLKEVESSPSSSIPSKKKNKTQKSGNQINNPLSFQIPTHIDSIPFSFFVNP